MVSYIEEEVDKGNEYVHSDRMQVGCPFAGQIFCREKTWLDQQVLDRNKKLGIVMGEVFEEMADQVSKGFTRFDILLTTTCAVTFFNRCSTVETGFIAAQVLTHKKSFFKGKRC